MFSTSALLLSWPGQPRDDWPPALLPRGFRPADAAGRNPASFHPRHGGRKIQFGVSQSAGGTRQ